MKKYYIMLAAVALYCAAKVWVAYTPTHNDDTLPDEVKAIVLQVLADNRSLVVVGDREAVEQSFGERD